ncbi:hypothetical protein AgCh_021350 [Apium graveolens]
MEGATGYGKVSIAEQSTHDEATVPESPHHSTGTEILELNTDAPVNMATSLEDVELYADVMEVSEAAEHDLQKQLKPIIAIQDKIEANQAKLEATQNKMSGKLDRSKGGKSLGRYKGGEIIGSSGTFKSIIQRSEGGRSGEAERKKFTTDERVMEAGVEVSQFMQTLKLKGRKIILFYKDPKITYFNSEVSRRFFLKENPEIDLEQLKLMEEEFKSLRLVNIDVGSPYDDILGQRSTKRVVIKEISQTKAERPIQRSQAILNTDRRTDQERLKADHTIPEKKLNSDLEDSNADKPELTFEEKKKML